MKVQPARAEAFITRPPGGLRAVLLFGPDVGGITARAQKLARTVVPDLSDGFRVTDLTREDLAKDPPALVDAVAALSLTRERRVVRLRGAGDAQTAAIGAAIAVDSPDCLLIVEGGDLPPRSSLRQLFEKADEAAAAIACYRLDGADVGRLARAILADHDLQLDPSAEDLLVDRLATDRGLAERELEKLALYALGQGRVDADAVDACIGDQTDQDMDRAVLAATDGDRPALDRALDRLFAEGTSPVAILRAAQRHVGRLADASASVAKGQAPDQAIAALRPPVFFKHRGRMTAQLRIWSPEKCARALDRLIDTEADCKKTGLPDRTLCSRVLYQISGMARR